MSSDIDLRKRAAAERAAAMVEDGMVLGLGTGSTAALALVALAARIRAGLRVVGIPSSRATEVLANQLDIPLVTLADHPTIDLTIDGADEVDPALDLIKGAGGALLREKVLASVSRQLVIVVDDSKLVRQLGQRSALPVEVVPFALPAVVHRLRAAGLQPTPRQVGNTLTLTDNGNYIIDCATGPITDARALDQQVRAITGVVDHGLFLGLTGTVVIGYSQDRVVVHPRGQPATW